MVAELSSHGSLGLLVVGGVILGYAVMSRRLATTVVSGPMVFVALGVLVGSQGLDLVDFSLSSDLVRTIVEATLVLVLFSDASRIDLAGLRRHLALPGRLLGIGLPLTVAAGVGVAVLVYPSDAVLDLALIAVILAPTDAALGQAVVSNPRVPAWVRQGLNVESGLNDGIAVPLFTVLTAIAIADTTGGHSLGTELVRQLGWGVVCGTGAGLVGGWTLRVVHRRGWISPSWTGIAGLLVAVLAYASAVSLDGSGFIAAFCAGMAFGHLTRDALPDADDFAEQAGQLFEAITFLIFGGAILTVALQHPSGRAILYAVLSLTVVRMVPVAIALFRSGSATPTVAFIGWFGPRGLASVLFLVLLLEEAPSLEHISTIAAAVTWTVALSVLLHGITAVPISGWYSSWYERHAQRLGAEDVVEASPTHEHRLRRTERHLFTAPSDHESERHESPGR